MTRDAAVLRMLQEFGFRPTGSIIDAALQNALIEAQRDLEAGKTLPRFLIQEDQTLVLATGQHSVSLPSGFMRIVDDNGIRYYTSTPFQSRPKFLDAVDYKEGIQAGALVTNNYRHTTWPKLYAIRNASVEFFTVATQSYTFYWSYYKHDAILNSNVENLWLANAPDWMMGVAGGKVAMSAGNQSAIAAFQAMEQRGRSMVFGDILINETAGGPVAMGSNQ